MGMFRIALFDSVNNEEQSEHLLAGEELHKVGELRGKVFCRFFKNHISKYKDIAKSSWYSVIYKDMGTALVAQWLRICLAMQRMWVQSLVGEVRSYMPQGKEVHVL